MASIIDVAKKAGVGIATVSRVINNSGYVKKETRDKIEKVIEEIGYVPNEIARSMTLQKNNIVAFILPNTTHLFFGELLYFVEEELFKSGYKMMLCNSSERLEKEIAYIDLLKKNRVDAIILLTNNDVEPYLDKTLPILSFDRKFDDLPFVASDNYHGGVLAARHLIKKQCKNIVFIGDDAQGVNTKVQTEVSKRRLGFLDELKRHQITNVLNIEYPLGNYIYIPEYVTEIIDAHPEIDGIFCISDSVAAVVIRHLEKIGKRVPEDVKVIGFDGGRSFNNLGKRITSIGQSPKLIAEAISQVIHNYYDKKTVSSVIVPIYFQEGDTA
ncbi:LacI family DNA-binding transcriptional regulator [Paracholeplasma manati]|jgi:DNA-binding LacI/PurR family transcriptional regulator|uniref:LacI family DNA-binding transcriptional regulator n=1 Tax=Paracholeplasma manati TaxID=591373 RepID=UPI002408485C|nr:LacI family DNA-binding transcriptional regulator [Paracholeplasma manati]MDG0888363.1 LacI family DNA-binding transcriptional regulator [Paracholeplasma manati]MDX9807070.1 LacI family DNA-binding transcriptional regulator [Acholeplasma sp.]